MNFKPLGTRILVKEKETQTTTASGIIIPDNADKDKPTQAKVIAIGSEVKDVNVDDTVIYGKFAQSSVVTLDNEDYLVMDTDEILGILA